MKTITKFLFLLTLGLCAMSFCVIAQTSAASQTNTAPALGVDSGIPLTAADMWTLAISGLSPIIVWGLTKVVPLIPKPVLPTITPFIGIVLGLILNKLSLTHLGWMDMAKAGALAVFVRETINQLITKQLEPDKPVVETTPAVPVTPPAPAPTAPKK